MFNLPEPEYQQGYQLSTTPPHSREAEEALIGAILINPDVYLEVSQFLEDMDFYIHRLRFIWTAYGRLYKRQVPIDNLTVATELGDMGRLEEIGGPAYLTALVNQVPSTLNAESYGRIIERASLRRKLLAAANSMADCAYDADVDPQDTIAQTFLSLNSMTAHHSRKEVSIRDAASQLYDEVEKIMKSGSAPGYLSGFLDYDRVMGGFVPGTSGLVAGRPGLGKTAWMLTTIAYMETKIKRPAVVFNSLEMPPKRLVARLAAIIGQIDADHIRKSTMDDLELEKFNHAISVIGLWPLTIIVQRDPIALYSQITQMRQTGKCDILFNDYVGKFEAKAENRVRQVGIASAQLAKIAVDLDIPVVTAAQVSRDIDTRGDDSKLVLKDLKESGDLEQDANWVLFLNPDRTDPRIRHCEIAKNRDGRVGNFDLLYRAQYTQFANATACKISEDV